MGPRRKTPTRPGPPTARHPSTRCYGNQALLTKKATEPRRGGERVSPIASLGSSRAVGLEIGVRGGLFFGRGRRRAGRGAFQPLGESGQDPGPGGKSAPPFIKPGRGV